MPTPAEWLNEGFERHRAGDLDRLALLRDRSRQAPWCFAVPDLLRGAGDVRLLRPFEFGLLLRELLGACAEPVA